ncbi:MAG TPA: hypothetical protein VNT58_06855 [Gaiellaceae bacterium]|nr:hypothetical protein [Gaiellaceae bacterium]
MRRVFLWLQLVFATIVIVGVWLQVYLIASFFFGADGALDAHETVGYTAVHFAEILAFLTGIGAWWRNWGRVGHSFGLALVGTVQIFLTGAEEWVGGLHGLLALVVLVMAVTLAKWATEELGFRRGRGGGGADSEAPRPLP